MTFLGGGRRFCRGFLDFGRWICHRISDGSVWRTGSWIALHFSVGSQDSAGFFGLLLLDGDCRRCHIVGCVRDKAMTFVQGGLSWTVSPMRRFFSSRPILGTVATRHCARFLSSIGPCPKLPIDSRFVAAPFATGSVNSAASGTARKRPLFLSAAPRTTFEPQRERAAR